MLLMISSTQQDFDAIAEQDGEQPPEPSSPVMVVEGRATTMPVIAGRLRELQEITDVHPARSYEIGAGEAGLMMAMVGDCFALAAVADFDRCSDGAVFVSTAEGTVPSAGETVRLLGTGGATSAFVVPAETGVARPYPQYGFNGLLITPKAMVAPPANPKGYVALYLEPLGIGVRAGSDLIEHVRNAVGLEPNVHFGLSEYSYGTRDDRPSRRSEPPSTPARRSCSSSPR